MPKNATEAAAWLRKAADQGLADAQNGLGLLAENGEGVPKSAAEAGRSGTARPPTRAWRSASTTWACTTPRARRAGQPGRGAEMVPQGGRRARSGGEKVARRRPEDAGQGVSGSGRGTRRRAKILLDSTCEVRYRRATPLTRMFHGSRRVYLAAVLVGVDGRPGGPGPDPRRLSNGFGMAADNQVYQIDPATGTISTPSGPPSPARRSTSPYHWPPSRAPGRCSASSNDGD